MAPIQDQMISIFARSSTSTTSSTETKPYILPLSLTILGSIVLTVIFLLWRLKMRLERLPSTSASMPVSMSTTAMARMEDGYARRVREEVTAGSDDDSADDEREKNSISTNEMEMKYARADDSQARRDGR